MLKKMMLLGASIAAFVAIAAPPAQAIELHEGGEALEVGAEIKLTSTDLQSVLTGIGTLKCEKVTIRGEVAENGPDLLVEWFSTETEGCTVPTTNPLLANLEIRNGDKGVATGYSVFIDGLNCSLSGYLNVTATTETDELHVAQTLVGSSWCNFTHITGTFTVETWSGTPVYFQ